MVYHLEDFSSSEQSDIRAPHRRHPIELSSSAAVVNQQHANSTTAIVFELHTLTNTSEGILILQSRWSADAEPSEGV